MHILGCRLDPLDAQQASDAILRYAQTGAGAQIVTLGTEMVVYAQRDARYRDVVNASTLSLCDTVGLLGVARLRGSRLRTRVTGVELLGLLCEGAAAQNIPVYLLGGAPGVAEAAAKNLEQRYHGLQVAGTHDGYFDEAASPEIAQAIKLSGAKLLFAGLGFPKQEFWLSQWLRTTGCGAGMGVGGSFDVISGKLERAPERWQRFHAEWLYRLIKEPQRWRRQMALPYFVLLAAREQVRLAVLRGKA